MNINARQAFSILQFCEDHDLSRATFYSLLRDGDAPETMRVRGRVLISREAAEQWRRRMEARTAAKQEA